MTIPHIAITAYEWRVLDFWKRNVNEGSVQRIMDLTETHDEYADEAGQNGQHCEYTRETLEPIRAEIADLIETIVERYEDLSSD